MKTTFKILSLLVVGLAVSFTAFFQNPQPPYPYISENIQHKKKLPETG